MQTEAPPLPPKSPSPGAVPQAYAQHGGQHADRSAQRCLSDVRDYVRGSRKDSIACGAMPLTTTGPARLGRPARLATGGGGSAMNQPTGVGSSSCAGHSGQPQKQQDPRWSDVPKLPAVPFMERLRQNGGVPLPRPSQTLPLHRTTGELASLGSVGAPPVEHPWACRISL